MNGTGAVVAIGVDRNECGSDGGRIARPEPSRGWVLPPRGRATLPDVPRGGRPQSPLLCGDERVPPHREAREHRPGLRVVDERPGEPPRRLPLIGVGEDGAQVVFP